MGVINLGPIGKKIMPSQGSILIDNVAISSGSNDKYQLIESGDNWDLFIIKDCTILFKYNEILDFALVGGGGKGGISNNSAYIGGHGGNGGYVLLQMNYASFSPLTSYNISIGAGGGNTGTTDGKGGNTTFSTFTAYGGEAASGNRQYTTGNFSSYSGNTGKGGTAVSGQWGGSGNGNPGNTGKTIFSGTNRCDGLAYLAYGGGGGAGSGHTDNGDQTSPYFVYHCTAGSGGVYGGGAGAQHQVQLGGTSWNAVAGTSNSGGGGGGGAPVDWETETGYYDSGGNWHGIHLPRAPANGGSGIVVIRNHR